MRDARRKDGAGMDKTERSSRHLALVTAIDYHSRMRPTPNYQQAPYTPPAGPGPEEIIATAKKFLSFMLVERKTVPPRGRQ